MTQQHPITLPPEVLQQLRSKAPAEGWFRDAWIAEQAAKWGADQELEACCEWINSFQNKFVHAHDLRLVRRPTPPSLKETLLARVARIPGEGADAAYLRHWVDNESQRLVDLLHEVFKSLPD